MRPAVHIALVVVGLAVAAYGTASMTGEWLVPVRIGKATFKHG